MLKIMKEHRHSIAKLLIECFFEDQLVIKQTKGIKDVEGFLEKLFLFQHEFMRGNYYHIKIIAISKENRGKGTFRELIMPIINYCKDINIPIILETNAAEKLPIYKHFGFQLVKTISKDGSDFCQYCFIKQP